MISVRAIARTISATVASLAPRMTVTLNLGWIHAQVSPAPAATETGGPLEWQAKPWLRAKP